MNLRSDCSESMQSTAPCFNQFMNKTFSQSLQASICRIPVPFPAYLPVGSDVSFCCGYSDELLHVGGLNLPVCVEGSRRNGNASTSTCSSGDNTSAEDARRRLLVSSDTSAQKELLLYKTTPMVIAGDSIISLVITFCFTQNSLS